MPLTADQIASNIVTQLRLLDPAMSAEVGTPERKIIEAVAEMVAGTQVDFSVLLQQHDLDAMTGGRLDAYLGNFGFGRQQPRSAVGRVTFSRSGMALKPITIPRGTQLVGRVDDSAFPNITFITTETVVLSTDSTSVDAPVLCTTTGTIGNLSANTIENFSGLKGIAGITSVVNTQPTAGGADGEDDAAYKLRFKNTLFRNMSGTYDQIMALAVSAATVTKANVVGPVSRYQEYLQVPGRNTQPVIETWTVLVPGTATTFTITVDTANIDGVASTTTANINEPATADTVLAAIITARASLAGNITVTRDAGPTNFLYTIQFVGNLAGRTGGGTSATGTSNVIGVAAAVTGGSGSTTTTRTVQGVAMADNDEIQRTEVGGYDDNDGTILDPFSWGAKRTTAVSTIPYSKHVYQDNAFLTDGTLDPGTAVFFRPGVDFIFNHTPTLGSAGSTYVNGTTYAIGDIVRGTGASGGGRLFLVTTGGTAATASPTWVTTTQYVSTTTFNGLVFLYIGLAPGSDFKRSHNYAVGDVVQVGTHIFVVSADAGSSAASVPAWDTDPVGNTSTVSSGITFQYLGVLRQPELTSLYPTKPDITVLGRYSSLDGSAQWPLGLEPGKVVLMEHQYMSKNSRNNVAAGVMNCVDVFVNGGDPVVVDSVEVMPGGLATSSNTLQVSAAGKWTYQKTSAPKVINFRRAIDGRECPVGSVIQPLYWQPVLELPDEILIGQDKFLRANYYTDSANVDIAPDGPGYYNKRTGAGTTVDPYVYADLAHYALALEVNNYYGTVRSRSGIEWFAAGVNFAQGIRVDGAGIETYTGNKFNALEGTQFTVSGYTYDQNIRALQSLQEAHKQVTTDILVHAALRRYFKVYITIMYTPGATQALVDASINASLAAFYENKYYGEAIQLSDVLQVVHNVPGVDNVRWTADVLYPSAVARVASTAYVVGDVRRPGTANGFVYKCVNAGTSSGTATGSLAATFWPTVDGETVTDGTVTWRALTEVRIEEVNKDGTALASGGTYFTTDFFIEDRELAAAPSEGVSVIVKRAQNVWNT